MPTSLQENFEEAAQKTAKLINAQKGFCEYAGHPERTETAQREALADTYRCQLRTAVAIFCLTKSANRNGGLDLKSERTMKHLRRIGVGSNFDPRQIAEEFNGLTEGEAVSRLRGMLSDIHTSSSLIAEQMGIAFDEEEQDINQSSPLS